MTSEAPTEAAGKDPADEPCIDQATQRIWWGMGRANTCLTEAIIRIDERFGDGFAMTHPEFTAAYMQTAVTYIQTAVLAEKIAALGDVLSGTPYVKNND
jgi:hypothetical protein